jgi:hypothetical protein
MSIALLIRPRLFVLSGCLLLLASGCPLRALEAQKSERAADLAFATSSDLADPTDQDLGTSKIDLATSASDLARPVVGVPCNGMLCATQNTCCRSNSDTAICVMDYSSPPDPCVAGASIECDGPEDCSGSLGCIGFTDTQGGTVVATICLTGGISGPYYTICHVDADCPSGGACMASSPPFPGAPALGLCLPMQNG